MKTVDCLGLADAPDNPECIAVRPSRGVQRRFKTRRVGPLQPTIGLIVGILWLSCALLLDRVCCTAWGEEIASAETQPTLAKPSTGKLEKLSGVFRKPAPASVEDLKSIERHVKSLVQRVSSTVVAVRVGAGSGSGVVISEDGLVLSAAHVCVQPGLDVTFIFPDGKTARGKTLGTNHEIDAGLMRITDSGRWPHATMGDLGQTRLGDWVLALGHPGGFDPFRSMVVRLGRIIRMPSGVLQTDCTLISGDSGGPLFDMHGRVVGIHSRISDSTAENFHVPIATYQETWSRLASGEDWGGNRPPLMPWVGAFGLDHPEGFRVELVNQGGPAEKAGVKVGDIITRMDGQEFKGYGAFMKRLARAKLGDKVKLAIKRDDSEVIVDVPVGNRPTWLR